MGYRLSRIVTRTGDGGETGLGDGTRVSKDSARIEALGDVDELNSQLGLLITEVTEEDVQACLVRIQNDLFDLGGELSIPGYEMLTEDQLLDLEKWLEQYNAVLTPLKEFILPGGTRASAQAHVARTVCRRAERTLVHLKNDRALPELGVRYLNRLADLLFVLARVLNLRAGQRDVQWKRTPRPTSAS